MEKMISITDKAKNQLLTLMQEKGHDSSYGVRVNVEGGGCSGLTYKLDFDNKAEEKDQVFEDKGLQIFVNMKSLLYIAGTELDFSDGLNGKGFQFNNPNASRTCACGESFAV